MAENTYTEEEILLEKLDALNRQIDKAKAVISEMQTLEDANPMLRIEGLKNSDLVTYIGLRAKLKYTIKSL